MILFNDVTTIEGSVQTNALAYVKECTIDEFRTSMSGYVTLSMQDMEPNYGSYCEPIKENNVPYDSESELSPVAQFYEHLMTLPMFAGGSQYPAV